MGYLWSCDGISVVQAGEPYSLPPRMLMTRLPLSTVQPRRAWAAVTESTIFVPRHTLGHRPAHGVQLSLGEEPGVRGRG